METKPNAWLKAPHFLVIVLCALSFFIWYGYSKQEAANIKSAEGVKEYAGDRIIIPKLNLTAQLIEPLGTIEQDFQKALENGVAHYPGTALPGEIGNCYIFGHSSDNLNAPGKFKTVFKDLPLLNIGDEVVVETKGFIYVYIIKENKVIEADELSVLSQDTAGRKILTLQTSYPIGTAQKRYIVLAEMK